MSRIEKFTWKKFAQSIYQTEDKVHHKTKKSKI